MNLSLVGMPGGGKSTVGRQLARHLGMQFVDADHELERRIEMPIRTFFEIHGEPAFRDLEEQVIADLSAQRGLVVATGGGAVLREANRQALRHGGHVVYLRTAPEELFRRLRHDTHRPLLQVADPLKRLRDMFRERDPLYRAAAHFVVEGSRPSVSAMLHMILAQLELAGLVDDQKVPSPVDPRPGISNVEPSKTHS